MAVPVTAATAAVGPTSRPSPSMLRRILSGAGTIACVGLLAFWFVALRPLSLGGPANYTVIHGNSMWPLYHDGDLIVTRQQSTYRVGDVVAYRVPKGEIGAGQLVIHRIVGGSPTTGLDLKGDNNPSVDPWHPKLADVAGSTWVQIPRFGRLLVALHQPLVPALVATLVTVAIILRRKPKAPRGQPGSLDGEHDVRAPHAASGGGDDPVLVGTPAAVRPVIAAVRPVVTAVAMVWIVAAVLRNVSAPRVS